MADRDDTLRMMRFFRSVWAPGRTRAESSINAATSIAALVAGSRPNDEEPASILSPPPIKSIPPPPKKGISLATRLKGLFARPDSSNELWSRPHEFLETEGWSRNAAPPFLTACNGKPAFSSSFYIPDDSEVPRRSVTDPMADKLQTHLDSNKAAFEQVWWDRQYNELEDWNDWIIDRLTELAREGDDAFDMLVEKEKADTDTDDEESPGNDHDNSFVAGPDNNTIDSDDDIDADEAPSANLTLSNYASPVAPTGGQLVPSTFEGKGSEILLSSPLQRRPSSRAGSDHSTDSERRATRRRADISNNDLKRRRSDEVNSRSNRQRTDDEGSPGNSDDE